MGIIKKNRPNSATLSATSGLFDLLGQDGQDSLIGGSGQSNILDPIPVYTVPALDFNDVSMTSWRYLIWDNNTDNAVCMVDVDAEDEEQDVPLDAFNGMTSGKPVSLFSEALNLVDKLFSKSSETFEIRILEIPNVNSSAIWLKGEENSHFVPFLESNILEGGKGISINQNYAEEMQSLLSSLGPNLDLK